LSTRDSASDIRELRSEVLRANAQLRVMSHLVQDGNVSLRDLLVLTRLFTGGSSELSVLIANIQAAIAITQTAITTLKLLEIEAARNPYLWPLIAIGAFVGLTLLSEMEMRRSHY